MNAIRTIISRRMIGLVFLWVYGLAWLGASNSARAADDTERSIGELMDLGVERLIEIPIVSSASKYEQSEARAPATVTVITADEVRREGQ